MARAPPPASSGSRPACPARPARCPVVVLVVLVRATPRGAKVSRGRCAARVEGRRRRSARGTSTSTVLIARSLALQCLQLHATCVVVLAGFDATERPPGFLCPLPLELSKRQDGHKRL